MLGRSLRGRTQAALPTARVVPPWSNVLTSSRPGGGRVQSLLGEVSVKAEPRVLAHSGPASRSSIHWGWCQRPLRHKAHSISESTSRGTRVVWQTETVLQIESAGECRRGFSKILAQLGFDRASVGWSFSDSLALRTSLGIPMILVLQPTIVSPS